MFVQASELTEHVPRIWAVLLAWSVSGVLTLFGALACAELASAFPRTGGVYVFLKETYSPVVGFLWGWAMFWVMHSGIIAAMATVFGRYAAFFVPLGDRGIRAVAVVGDPRHLGAQLRRREARQRRPDDLHDRQGDRGRADRRRRLRRRIAAAAALPAGRRGGRRTR